MSQENRHSRRTFMAGALGLAGAVPWLSGKAAAAIMPTEPQLLLFDPARIDACRWAASVHRGCVAQPIIGDRVRFARSVLGAQAPQTVAGLSSYADFILLSGSAAESGYRLVRERLYPTAAGELRQGALVYWVLERARRAQGVEGSSRG